MNRLSVLFAAALAVSTGGAALAGDWFSYLRSFFDQSVRTIEGADGWKTALVFTPDGEELIASTYSFGALTAWPVSGDGEPRKFDGDPGAPRTLQLTSDGRRVVSGGADAVAVWSIEQGKALSSHEFDRTPRTVASAAILSDGAYMLYAHYAPLAGLEEFKVSIGWAEVWNVAEGRQERKFEELWGSEPTVAVSPDGRFAIVGANESGLRGRPKGFQTIVQYETEGWSVVRRFDEPRSVLKIAFSPDGALLAVAGYDRVVVRDAQSGEVRYDFDKYDELLEFVDGVVFSNDGRWLVTANEGDKIQVWDLEKETLAKTLKGHGAKITALAISPDSRLIASAAFDDTIKLWEMPR